MKNKYVVKYDIDIDIACVKREDRLGLFLFKLTVSNSFMSVLFDKY